MNLPYNTEQSADFLGIPKGRLLQQIKKKQIHATKWGWQYAITREELLAHANRLARGEIKVGRPRKVKPEGQNR